MIYSVNPKEYHVKLLVQGKPVTCLLDTGASASLLPVKYVDTPRLHLGQPKTLHMWNGTTETSYGTAKLRLTNPVTHEHHHVLFNLVRGDHKPILGLQDVLRMNLITINLDNFERVLAHNQSKPQKRRSYNNMNRYLLTELVQLVQSTYPLIKLCPLSFCLPEIYLSLFGPVRKRS